MKELVFSIAIGLLSFCFIAGFYLLFSWLRSTRFDEGNPNHPTAWPEQTVRIVYRWNDFGAGYAYHLEKWVMYDYPLYQGYWRLITLTSDRHFAKRWAEHYGINLPDLPVSRDHRSVS